MVHGRQVYNIYREKRKILLIDAESLLNYADDKEQQKAA